MDIEFIHVRELNGQSKFRKYYFNHYPAEFHKWTWQLQFLELIIIKFRNIRIRISSWPVCTDLQAGQALYWWQRLNTLASSRLSVKLTNIILVFRFNK
jgi:hypothetical protein